VHSSFGALEMLAVTPEKRGNVRSFQDSLWHVDVVATRRCRI